MNQQPQRSTGRTIAEYWAIPACRPFLVTLSLSTTALLITIALGKLESGPLSTTLYTVVIVSILGLIVATLVHRRLGAGPDDASFSEAPRDPGAPSERGDL